MVNKNKYMLSKLNWREKICDAQIHVIAGTGCTILKKLIFFIFQMSVVWTVGLHHSHFALFNYMTG